MDAKKFKVIVVDDSKFSIKIISELINKSDRFEVIAEFTRPEEALLFSQSSDLDIAIIDVVMPNMSGIELAKKISNLSPSTKIIMISSLAGENIVIDSISAGAIDYIQKPFTEDKLLTSLINATFGIE